MSKGLYRLSAKGVESLLKQREHGYGSYTDGGGLTLVIDKSGARWVFKYNSPVTKKRRDMGLGSLATGVVLAKAREAADIARAQVRDGVDPILARTENKEKARQEQEALKTFKQCADETADVLAKGWAFKGARERWDQVVGELGALLEMPVAYVKGTDIAKALTVFDDRPTTKKYALSVIKRTIETAIAAELRNDNPAMMSRISKLTPMQHEGGNNPSMPYINVPAYVMMLRGKSTRAARALELLILCGSRKDEVCSMRRDELDLDAALWTIPAERTKQGREHVVPLCARAVEILRQQLYMTDCMAEALNASSGEPVAMPAHVWGDWQREKLSHNAFDHLLPANVSVHGFRSSLREFLGDETNVSWNTAEETLGHKVGDATAQAYRRAPGIAKRRVALQNWADFLDGNLRQITNITEKAQHLQLVKGSAA